MLRPTNRTFLLLLGMLICISSGCGKDEKDKTPVERPAGAADARARNACEETVQRFLDAATAEDYRQALGYVDVEEMVRKGREQAATSTATPPDDVERMKQSLIRMLQAKAGAMAGLSYKTAGARVSGDQAVVDFEAYRDGELAHYGRLTLAKKKGGWKLSGSAVPMILPPAGAAPSAEASQ